MNGITLLQSELGADISNIVQEYLLPDAQECRAQANTVISALNCVHDSVFATFNFCQVFICDCCKPESLLYLHFIKQNQCECEDHFCNNFFCDGPRSKCTCCFFCHLTKYQQKFVKWKKPVKNISCKDCENAFTFTTNAVEFIAAT